ncbi:MAG: zinc ribbon domain-containing protein [Actinomycetota bacterium]|nr:zinc ribbon domain-containing protein [Actinomycetota bacterium]
MTAQQLPEVRCSVCGTVVSVDARNCPSCGLHRPAARGRGVLARTGLWVAGSFLLVAWVVALAVVAAAR